MTIACLTPCCSSSAGASRLPRPGRSTNSISSAVVNRPRPKRRLPRTASSAQPQAPQDMTRLGLGRGAGAAGAQGNVAHLDDQGLALDIAETDVQIARQPKARQIEGRTIERDVAEARGSARRRAGRGGRSSGPLRPEVPPGKAPGPGRNRRCPARWPCRSAVRLPARRRRSAVPSGPAGRDCERTRPRCPWVRRSCGP